WEVFPSPRLQHDFQNGQDGLEAAVLRMSPQKQDEYLGSELDDSCLILKRSVRGQWCGPGSKRPAP
uniref:Uncharacterized protein n=1 Tax=Cairina moschata TaxID=8855 RepID=A0A8C3CM81_CAIMO